MNFRYAAARVSHGTRARQRGSTLLVVLVLLLAMTLLALASLRVGSLEERMTANLFDRGLAFQATEAALREGEERAMSLSAPPSAGDCADGLCGWREPMDDHDYELFLFESHARAAKAMSDNTLAVPKASDVRYLILHQGSTENTYGCSRVLDANGRPKDPLCLSDVYRIDARYRTEGRASARLHSVVLVPAPPGEDP
ncbi:pilus assembly PilX family protein [Pseudoxanthomonas beigongshangi]